MELNVVGLEVGTLRPGREPEVVSLSWLRLAHACSTVAARMAKQIKTEAIPSAPCSQKPETKARNRTPCIILYISRTFWLKRYNQHRSKIEDQFCC